MFSNAGWKIKFWAKISFGIGVICAIIVGLYFIFSGIQVDNIGVVFLGIVYAGLIVVASWVSSLLIYGFGKLVENSCYLVEANDVLLEMINDEKDNEKWENIQ